MVKINKAGPRPEYEQAPRDDTQAPKQVWPCHLNRPCCMHSFHLACHCWGWANLSLLIGLHAGFSVWECICRHVTKWCARLQAGSDTSNGGGHQTLGGSGMGGGSIASSGAHGRGPRLYVGGVPDEITEEDIIEHFNKWGNVVDVYFPGKKGAKRVNYCFVTYDNWRSAQRACNQSERNIDGKVSLLQPRVSQQQSNFRRQ